MNAKQLRRFVLAAGIAALGGIGVCMVYAQNGKAGRAKQETPLSASMAANHALLVDAVCVQAQSVQPEEAISGQVEPVHIATVAAEIGKRIVLRPIQQGDRIVQGQTLAELDPEAAQAALDQANATLAQATAARRQAESDYVRAVVETDAARQQARAQVEQAESARQQAHAQEEQAAAGQHKIGSLTRIQELRQAEAALAQAQTEEKLARIEADRYTGLVKEGAAPQQTLDHMQASLEGATARRQAAEQAVSLAKEGARQEDIAAARAAVDAAKAQVDSTTAQVAQAQAALRIADTRDVRLATLRDQITGLRAQEAQAQAGVRQARITLEKHRITAPFTGRVLATLAEAGEMTTPGSPVARIGAIDPVKVTFSVPEESRCTLHLNQTVAITADARPGQRFTGRITALGYQADPRSRTFPAEVTVQNPQEQLLPNMVARLRLTVGTAQTHPLIPVSAVATDGAQAYVFVLQSGRAVRRDVTLGAPQADKVEILNGLLSGETIAATPQRLSDGMPVRLNTVHK